MKQYIIKGQNLNIIINTKQIVNTLKLQYYLFKNCYIHLICSKFTDYSLKIINVKSLKLSNKLIRFGLYKQIKSTLDFLDRLNLVSGQQGCALYQFIRVTVIISKLKYPECFRFLDQILWNSMFVIQKKVPPPAGPASGGFPPWANFLMPPPPSSTTAKIKSWCF